MGIVIRQSTKSVFLTYMGICIGVINTLWLLPYALTEEHLGLYRAIISAAVLFSTFASLGAANIPTRFFFYFKDLKNRHNGILFFICLLGLTGFLILTFFFIQFRFLFVSAFIKNAPLILNYYFPLILFALILLFINIFEAYNIIQQNPVIPTFLREVLTRAFLSVCLILYLFFKFNYYSFILFLIGAYAIILLILIFYTDNQHYLFIKPDLRIFKSPLLKEIFVFTGFASMANISAIIITNIDSLMLSAYSGFRNTGIYTISFFIAAFIAVPKKALSQVLIPLVSEANKNLDKNKLNELYKKSSITQLIIGGLLFLLIWVNIENVFKLIPHGSVYSQGKWVVFIIGLGYLFDMTTGINQEIVGTSKYYKIDLMFYPFLGVIAIGANMFFIPKYGITGAAIATAFSIFLLNTIRFCFLYIVFKIQPFSFNTVKALSIFIFVIIITYYVPEIHNHFLYDIILKSFVLTTVFIFLVIFLKPSEDINLTFYKLISRIKIYYNTDK
ncbi:MAG: oligosaccharide flippase family protein [Ignavibacteriaceae bacterium]|nr:oligosaccharide flippase family protein [Ignavibacteriaceae bacterium]